MKSHVRFPLASLLVVATGLSIGTQALAQTDRLPSWNDGPAKQAIIKFAGLTAFAAEPLEHTKNILAAQLRDQGYECDQPKSAERDIQASKPDEEVWIVQCEHSKYRMRLDPDMAARVERID
jgi:hypothetical protein